MPSESRGTTTNIGSTTAVAVTLTAPPGPQSYLLITVAVNLNTATIASITSTAGTFVRLASIASSTNQLELWLGYGFGLAAPTTITVTRSGGTTMAVHVRTVDLLADCTTAPSTAASTGQTGTSTTADSGTLTPAVGDILLAGHVVNANSASNNRTHTGNNYLQNGGVANAASYRIEAGWCEAVAAVASKEVWTNTSQTWAAVQVKITPPAPPTPTAALLLKGMTTQAADAASPY